MFLGWETKIRSERRMGELLPEMIKHGGDRKSRLHDETLKLEDLGITKIQSFRYQTFAGAVLLRYNEPMAYLRRLKRIYHTDKLIYPDRGKFQYKSVWKYLGLDQITRLYGELGKSGLKGKALKNLEKKLLKTKYTQFKTPKYNYLSTYWIIEESYREGPKVKSRVLYSLSKYFRNKPTKKQIKKLLDRKLEEIEIAKAKAYGAIAIFGKNITPGYQTKTLSDSERWFYGQIVEKPQRDYDRLLYAYRKLNDRRW